MPTPSLRNRLISFFDRLMSKDAETPWQREFNQKRGVSAFRSDELWPQLEQLSQMWQVVLHPRLLNAQLRLVRLDESAEFDQELLQQLDGIMQFCRMFIATAVLQFSQVEDELPTARADLKVLLQLLNLESELCDEVLQLTRASSSTSA